MVHDWVPQNGWFIMENPIKINDLNFKALCHVYLKNILSRASRMKKPNLDNSKLR